MFPKHAVKRPTSLPWIIATAIVLFAIIFSIAAWFLLHNTSTAGGLGTHTREISTQDSPNSKQPQKIKKKELKDGEEPKPSAPELDEAEQPQTETDAQTGNNPGTIRNPRPTIRIREPEPNPPAADTDTDDGGATTPDPPAPSQPAPEPPPSSQPDPDPSITLVPDPGSDSDDE